MKMILASFALVANALLLYYQQSNFRLQQRAWVGVTIVTLKDRTDANKFPGAQFELTNSGATPAMQLNFTQSMAFASHDTGCPQPSDTTVQPLPGEIPLPVLGTVMAPTRLWMNVGAVDLGDGQFVVICGELEYTDIFSSTVRTTSLCIFYRRDEPASRAEACPTGNYMD